MFTRMSRFRLLGPLFAITLGAVLIGAVALPVGAQGDEDDGEDEGEYTDSFNIEHCTWVSSGQNLFFSLNPGTRHVLEGEEAGETITTIMTVLQETERVGRVKTRVVEEQHFIDGELDEVSRNWFALCRENGSIFYFGEEVDYYEDGEIAGHEGAWRAGENGAEPGLYMPGIPLLGARYYQEIAPGAALDRAEIIALDTQVTVPAGSFDGCMETLETTPLEPGNEDVKVYCPVVGIVDDAGQVLISYEPGHPGRWPGR